MNIDDPTPEQLIVIEDNVKREKWAWIVYSIPFPVLSLFFFLVYAYVAAIIFLAITIIISVVIFIAQKYWRNKSFIKFKRRNMERRIR